MLTPHHAHAEGSVTDCSQFGPGSGTLQTALKGGGLVTFECSGVIIIPEIQLGLTNLILDGTGQHVTLDGNHANRLFDVGDGNLEIRYLTLTGGNSVLGGGAIFSGGQVTITHSLIFGNEANYGGALEIYNGRVLIVSSTITDNYANSDIGTGGGGAIDQYYQYWAGLDVQSKSSLVAAGRAQVKPGDEGKIVPAGESSPVPDVTILFSTITNNRAEIDTRAGLWRENGNLTLEGTIIAENDGRDCLIEGTASFNPKNANLDSDGSCSASIHADPLLTPLGDYGGPTLMFGLKSNSPAIDAAPPGVCLAPTDQRRIQRPRAATRDQIAACDLGAFEFARYYYGDANFNDGLVGHWRFDEGAGLVALDSSGHANNGVIGPTVEYTTDIAPVAFTDLYSLSSSRSGMVTVPDSATLNPPSSMTLAAWVRLNRTHDAVRIIDKVGNTATGPGYLLGVQNGVLRADFWDSADTRHTITAGLVVTGTWIHVAVTWSANGVATTYVNGVPAGSQPAGTDLKASSAPLRITISGQMDDVRIYNRELSVSQIGALAGGGSCVETGTTWNDAVPDLQCALAGMGSGNSLWVAKGIYVPFRGPDPEISFVLPSGASMYGGFPVGATSLNQRDLANNPSVLSGDSLGDDRTDHTGVVTDVTGIVGLNARHVVVLSGELDETILDGFIVTAGSARNSADEMEADTTATLLGSGAGIYISSGAPLLRRLLLVGNWASYQGGAVYIMSGAPRWLDVVIRSNRANRGGALAMENGAVVMANGLIAGNYATSIGGAVWAGAGSLHMVNVTVAGNRARTSGGGIAMANCTFEGENSIFANNSAADRPQVLNECSARFKVSKIEDGCPNAATCTNVASGAAGFSEPVLAADAPTLLGDYSLIPTATEIDAGNNSAALPGVLPDVTTIGELSTDAIGTARLIAVHQPAKIIDLGALEAPNTPPRYISFPIKIAATDEPYTYTVVTTDANEPSGTGVTVSAPVLPSWMKFKNTGENTGRITGTPTEGELGKHAISIRATDPGGASAKQEFELEVEKTVFSTFLPAVRK